MSDESLSADMDSLLWSCKECMVYQIPPLKNESGHRANDWDVNKWLWIGSLKVTARGNVLSVTLHDAKSGELFAACPVTEAGSKAIDPVIDSSRYFVLRLDDGKGKHAFMGMGFRERPDAYDFKTTLDDHWRRVQREKEAEELAAKFAAEPMRDLSLKDGETLSIKVNVPGAKPRAARPKPAEGGSSGAFALPPPPGKPGLLAPPPKAGAPGTPASPPPPSARADADDDFGEFGDFSSTAVSGGGGDDDFGDFSSAT